MLLLSYPRLRSLQHDSQQVPKRWRLVVQKKSPVSISQIKTTFIFLNLFRSQKLYSLDLFNQGIMLRSLIVSVDGFSQKTLMHFESCF